MIQGELFESYIVKDKGALFQQEVVDKLLEVRKGFTSQDVRSCPMSVHGEDIILSPKARRPYPSLSSTRLRRDILLALHGNRHTVRQKSCVCPYSLNQWPSSRWMVKCLWWS
jgi:hypothetical protein